MKFNTKKSESDRLRARPDFCPNEEGGIAFRPDMKTELMLRTVSSLVSEDGFYKKGSVLDSKLRDTIHAVAREDPEFILKLALYARSQMHLRSVPIVLMGEFAISAGKGNVENASRYIAETIQRPDEITELIAYVQAQNKYYKGKMPMMIKKGVRQAFGKFDAYQLAKYRTVREITLRDAMFMTHPKPTTDMQAKTYADLAAGTLASADTWEHAISTEGSTKEAWENIIPKMGYMALLRNLRNFLDKGVDIQPVLGKIANPAAVMKSKQFPFRFWSAYKEVKGRSDSGNVLDALSDAADVSVQNVPKFPGVTFVTCDVSGSMFSPISNKSTVQRSEIGCMFGAMVHAMSENAITSVFGLDHKVVSLSRRDSLFTNTGKLLETDVGHATNAHLAIDYLIKNKKKVDRIIIFSDMQCYGSHGWEGSVAESIRRYRHTINKDVYVYSFDLANYGTTQIPKGDPRTFLAGGFSDQVLQFIPFFESSKEDMLSEIENIRII